MLATLYASCWLLVGADKVHTLAPIPGASSSAMGAAAEAATGVEGASAPKPFPSQAAPLVTGGTQEHEQNTLRYVG